jgi:agmatinase
MDNKRIGIVGIPFDEKSSFLRGAAQGPDKIRESLNDGSSSFVTESGIELLEDNHFVDLGNIEVRNYLEDIESGITHALSQESKLITLGGDHSIAYPIIKAYQKQYPVLNILQFDAHTDLYDEFEGDPFSHACPFARIMEQDLAQSLTQVGIRVLSNHQKEQQQRFGVNILTMRDWVNGIRPILNGPVYISLDLDVFDPGFAPGISHHEPGGMSPREVIELILNIDVPILGADIVELNPSRDHHGMTGMLAAKLLKELIGKMYLQ